MSDAFAYTLEIRYDSNDDHWFRVISHNSLVKLLQLQEALMEFDTRIVNGSGTFELFKSKPEERPRWRRPYKPRGKQHPWRRSA